MTVPAALARRAGMRPGTRLDWRATDDVHTLEVKVLPDPASLASTLRGRGNAARRLRGSAVDRLVRERLDEDRRSEKR